MTEDTFPTRRIVAIVIVISMLLVAGFLGLALAYKEFFAKETVEDAYLIVEEVYFVLETSEPGGYRLKVSVFITNAGEKDCYTKLRGFGIDKGSNLAMDDTEVGIGLIEAGTTGEYTGHLEFSYNGTFRVELIIFKDGLISVKGLGFVNLADQGTGGQDYKNTDWDGPVEEKTEPAMPFIGIAPIIAIAAIAALGYTAFRRRRCRP